MAQLAVVVMAYNEAEVLQRCCETLAEHVAASLVELHISVDAQSTDECMQIAYTCAHQAYTHQGLPETAPAQDAPKATEAQNSYSRMRNQVLDGVCSQTAAPWLMWLDADEIVEAGLPELVAMLPQVPAECEAVAVTMRLLTPDGACDSVMRNSKVIRRHVRFTRRRHEHIVIDGTQLIFPQCSIAHLPTQPDEARAAHDRRKLQYEAFVADWREFGDGRAAFYMGDWWRVQGNPDEALVWWQRGLDMPDSLCIPSQRAQLGVYAGKLYMQTGNATAARAAFMRALEMDWQYGEAVYYLGALAANTGDHAQAKHWLTIAAQHYPDDPQTLMQQEDGCTRDLPYYALACIAADEGKRAEAYRLLDQAERRAHRPREFFTQLRLKLDTME